MSLQPCRNSLRSSLRPRTALPITYRSYSPEVQHVRRPLNESLTGIPRWKKTPTEMVAPKTLNHAKDARNTEWKSNEDPAKLDAMYDKLLGPGGSALLPEELKWLAITHKSFDQGRRGFNDRLALMGRTALVMEATKEIVAAAPQPGSIQADKYGRVPKLHEQLKSVDNLGVLGPRDVAGKDKLAKLADSVGLAGVIRWKPRMVRDLEESGLDIVLAGGIMAILGAVTLQHGSVVASRVIRERILERMSTMEG